MRAQGWRCRAARVEDATALAAFWRDSFVDTFGPLYAPQDLAAFLARSYGAPVQAREIAAEGTEHQLAWSGSTLSGAIQIGPLGLPIDPGGAAALELKRLYVAQAAKGRGLAQTLTEWAIDRARARGAQALFLGVWRHNARAQRFYARQGFRKVGEYLFAVGAAQDEEDILRLDL